MVPPAYRAEYRGATNPHSLVSPLDCIVEEAAKAKWDAEQCGSVCWDVHPLPHCHCNVGSGMCGMATEALDAAQDFQPEIHVGWGCAAGCGSCCYFSLSGCVKVEFHGCCGDFWLSILDIGGTAGFFSFLYIYIYMDRESACI